MIWWGNRSFSSLTFVTAVLHSWLYFSGLLSDAQAVAAAADPAGSGSPTNLNEPNAAAAAELSSFGSMDMISRQCQKPLTEVETFDIGPSDGKLAEIHVRHNIKGEVEILDGERDGSVLRVEIHKSAFDEVELKKMVVEQSLHTYDPSYGKILLLQVDYQAKATSLLTIIGGVVAVVVLLTAIIVIIWLYHKHHNEPPPSSRRSSYSSQISPAARQSSSRMETPPPPPPHPAQDLSGGGARLNRSSPATTLRTPRFHTSSSHTSESDEYGRHTPSPPPPPPPPELNNGYHNELAESPPPPPVRTGGGGGRLYKRSFVTISILSVISLVYASCMLERQARVVIIIPPMLKLSAVEIFFNDDYYNEVKTSSWIHQNQTRLQIFDIPGVHPTKLTCSTKNTCPTADVIGLAGCDSGTGNCVCQRGYRMSSGFCLDVDECAAGIVDVCPLASQCENTIGSHICHCPKGFFYQQRSCKPCSISCPVGQFESASCAVTHDIVCADCQQCGWATYEAKLCQGADDRQCLHAAHPVLLTEDDSMPTFIEGLRVEASSNVFLENLHNTRHLETTYYVTDTKQSTDFFWYRDSGIRVNIGLLNINMIPEYEDVDRESDNAFIERRPNAMDQRQGWENIIEKHCRHPIPDYYTITLEVAKDRSTEASEEVCQGHSGRNSECPPGVSKGETYLRRSLNEACEKMGTFPTNMQPAINSIVCTDHASLLEDVFNVKSAPVRPISFPSGACRRSMAECDRCLKEQRCQHTDIFDSHWCQLDCYSRQNCKTATSHTCTSSPVECAMGDAYRYTLQPIYANLNYEFQCHIRHRKPDMLYKLWFYVTVPNTDFETPRIYKTITAEDVENLYHGQFSMDFITIEHNTGIELHDDFILHGREFPGYWNYTLQVPKNPADYSNKSMEVRSISPNVHVANVQFDEPFGYSTSTWVNGNNCTKDITKFKHVQKHYKGTLQNVNVITQTTGSPFEYFLKSQDNPPYMKFTIPANISVLSWWFSNKGPMLILDDTLQTKLTLESLDRIWNIQLSGTLSDCPGYLSITVNDRKEAEEVFKYDLIISCPPTFNLTFKVPNWGLKEDKTFDVTMDDAKQKHRIFLTNFVVEDIPKLEPKKDTVWDIQSSVHHNPPDILVATCLLFGAFILFCAVYMYLVVTKQGHETKYKYASYESASNIYSLPQHKPLNCCQAMHSMSRGKMTFVILYIACKIIYNFLFTFTIFFTVLILCLHGNLGTLTQVDDLQNLHRNRSHKLQQAVEKHVEIELKRHTMQAKSMQGACGEYMEDLMNAMLQQMDNVTKMASFPVDEARPSISYVFKERFKNYITAYDMDVQSFIKDYSYSFNASIKPALDKYQHMLKKIYMNNWFMYPLALYNESKTNHGAIENIRHQKALQDWIFGEDVDFGKFLQIEEDVANVQLWPQQFWERFQRTKPEDPELNAWYSSEPLLCNIQTDNDRVNISAPLDSSYHQTVIALSDTPSAFVLDGSNSMTFSVEEFLESLNLGVLRLIFFCLDLLLLIWRFTHLCLSVNTLCVGFELDIEVSSKDVSEYQEQTAEQIVPLHSANDANEHPDSASSDFHPEDGTTANPTNYKHSKLKQHKPNGDVPHHDPLRINTAPDYAHHATNITTPHQKSQNVLWFNAIRSCAQKLLLGSFIPKIAIAIVIFLLLSVILNIAKTVFLVEVFSLLSGYSPFSQGLELHLESANQFLEMSAGKLTASLETWYQAHVKSELLQLQGIVEFFNMEQQRLTYNYRQEVCAIKGFWTFNANCTVVADAYQANVPMLPCNFMPISAQLYPEMGHQAFLDTMIVDYQPVVSTARSTLEWFVCGIIYTCIVMILLHLSGILLFLALSAHNIFPTRPVYIITSYLAPSSKLVQPGPSKPLESAAIDDVDTDHSIVASTPQTLPRHAASGQHGSGVLASRTLPPKVPMRTTSSSTIKSSSPWTHSHQVSSGDHHPDHPSTSRGEQPLLHDMGYSETKV